VKFDGDFEKNQDYFLMNKIMKEKSDVALLPLFYLTAGADSSENAYYLPYLELLNKKRKAPFAFVSRVNTKTLTSGDFLSSHDSGIVAGVRIALEGNYNSSLNCFDSLAKVYPLSCNVFFNRAWVKASNVELMRTFDEMPQEISVYSNSLQLNSRVQMNHREQYFDYYGVLDDYSKVISLEPSLFYAYYNRACIQVKLYNYAEAIKDYSLAIDLNRDFKEAYYNRGITHIYLSDTTNACYDLSKAGELGVDNAYLLIRKLCRK
jgi:tetratricopeptide (TPR) repeat protein